MKQIAVFDFDGTITTKDTFIVFGKYAVGTPRFLMAMLRTAPWLAAWKAGLIRGGQAKEKLFSTLFRGMSIDRFNALGSSFAAEIDRILRPDTIAALKEHQSHHRDCYIVSASLENWIRPWAQANGITALAGTVPEVDAKGLLTGHFLTPNCRGAEKLNRLAQLRPDYPTCEMWAYGDSSGDNELLAAAQHPKRV